MFRSILHWSTVFSIVFIDLNADRHDWHYKLKKKSLNVKIGIHSRVCSLSVILRATLPWASQGFAIHVCSLSNIIVLSFPLKVHALPIRGRNSRRVFSRSLMFHKLHSKEVLLLKSNYAIAWCINKAITEASQFLRNWPQASKCTI